MGGKTDTAMNILQIILKSYLKENVVRNLITIGANTVMDFI